MNEVFLPLPCLETQVISVFLEKALLSQPGAFKSI